MSTPRAVAMHCFAQPYYVAVLRHWSMDDRPISRDLYLAGDVQSGVHAAGHFVVAQDILPSPSFS